MVNLLIVSIYRTSHLIYPSSSQLHHFLLYPDKQTTNQTTNEALCWVCRQILILWIIYWAHVVRDAHKGVEWRRELKPITKQSETTDFISSAVEEASVWASSFIDMQLFPSSDWSSACGNIQISWRLHKKSWCPTQEHRSQENRLKFAGHDILTISWVWQ